MCASYSGAIEQANHVPCITAAAIELRTEMLLEGIQPGMSKRVRVIPIDRIAEEDFGLDIDYQYITADGSIPGLIFFNDSTIMVYEGSLKDRKKLLMTARGCVVLERSLCAIGQEFRCRFALAHELGHWVLHADFLSGHPYTSLSQTEKNQLEWQADYFASCLLMPRSALCAMVRDWLNRQKLSLSYLRSIHKREVEGSTSLMLEFIQSVSRTFEVPHQAAQKHLHLMMRLNFCQH